MNDLITAQEIEVYRNPSEFITWFETYLAKTKIDRRYREEILLKKGIFKVIYEEVFPLYRFLQIFGGEWHDLKFRNVIGDQNYDVEVIGSDERPFNFIEITVADMDRNENLRMKYFLENGSVSLIGEVTSTGTQRTGLNIEVDNGALCHDKINEAKKIAISNAICRKASKNYPDDTILLVYFDDYVACAHEGDRDDIIAFIESIEDTWTVEFSSLYLVGASGRRGWLKLRCELESSLDNTPKIDAQMNWVIRQQRLFKVIECTRITNEENS